MPYVPYCVVGTEKLAFRTPFADAVADVTMLADVKLVADAGAYRKYMLTVELSA